METNQATEVVHDVVDVGDDDASTGVVGEHLEVALWNSKTKRSASLACVLPVRKMCRC